MPIQPINYANIPTLRGPFQGIDFGDLLKQGMQLRHEPQRLLQERQQAELSNRLGQQKYQMQEAEMPFAGPRAEAELQHKLAQAKREEAMANLPLGGGVNGDVMQDLVVHRLLNDPNVPKELKDRLSRGRESIVRQREMGNTPASAKLREDNERIMNDPSIPDDQKREMIALNNAANVKGSVIPELEVQRTRADITSEGFNKLLQDDVLDALTQYSGTEGAKQRIADEWEKFWTKKTPERLLRFEDAEATAEGVAMNLRAAIKESVAPKTAERILDMISPANLKRSKEQAQSRVRAAAAFFEDIERKNINKSTGRGGAHNETLNELDKKTKNMQTVKNQAKAAKSQNIKPVQKNEGPPKISHIWKDGRWVSA